MDPAIVARLVASRGIPGILASCAVVMAVGGMAYGAAFGMWRSWTQAAYAAVKMPAMLFLVSALCGAANTAMAQALGLRISLRQAVAVMFIAFAIASAFLGSIAPCVAFLAAHAPSPSSAAGMAAYRVLLPAMTGLVGVAGLAGCARLHRLLVAVAGSRELAHRVLACWIAVCGLVGGEISWLFSPFVARPDLPVPFLNPNALRGNFIEYLWRTVQGAL